jgi:hypothetical protein
MATIYNTYTKRKISGVYWAKRGRFWYKKGGKAKYYPKNGWKSSGYRKSYRKSYRKRY